MYASSWRARWPLAFTLPFALALVGACADETTSPTLTVPLRPNAAAGDVYLVTTPYDSGAIGSLRWALRYATGGETIRFDPSLAGKTVWVDGLIALSVPVTIEGPAGEGITISGAGGSGRLFNASYTGTTTIRNVTITGFNSGISAGPVMLTTGGSPNVVFENSLLHGNTGGGGTVVWVNKVTLINSTVSNNIATSVASGNIYGAAEGDTVVVINSTVTNNGDAGVVAWAPITIRNSIIADHPRNNCFRHASSYPITREGTNVSDDDTCGGPSEVVIADPKLAPLADNGGPTMTRALMTGSPAINTGKACSVSVDQRYFQRDAQCDVGAFEFGDFTTVSLTIDPNAIVRQATGGAVVTGTIRCSRAESFALNVLLTQDQKSGKTLTTVHAHSDVPVACSTTARTFSASMMLEEGVFEAGSAVAEVHTLGAEPWVTPASASGAVRLFRGR